MTDSALEINSNGRALQALTPGDSCVLTVRTGRGVTYQTVTVQRVTKTQIIADGKRYLVSTGAEYGANNDPFHSNRLTPWIDIEQAKNRAEEARRREARNKLCRELGGMTYAQYYALTDKQLDTLAGWLGLEERIEND